ncbi:hypothetical protein GCM10025784_17010 [Citricoccus nitrophenolicus]
MKATAITKAATAIHLPQRDTSDGRSLWGRPYRFARLSTGAWHADVWDAGSISLYGIPEAPSAFSYDRAGQVPEPTASRAPSASAGGKAAEEP